MISDRRLLEYAESVSSPESDLLRLLDRDTHLHVVAPNMLSGHIQGKFLEMISHMIRPATILEIGTYTAYGTICLAAGLREGGILHTIESNIEIKGMIQTYLTKAGLDHRVKVHFGDALQIIPAFNEVFDLVFIDGAKEQYISYYEMVFDKVRPGGFILADNVLWGGKVLDEKPDTSTRAILDFNCRVRDDRRVDNVLLPMRDGMMLIRKIS
ncbi:MAG: O-methyltransferase [Bacteroidetes bacterium]|nr:O-methyltransferase [Bacteroidota bacterium]